MSKAKKFFEVITQRRHDEMSRAFREACRFMTVDCDTCPLENDDLECALCSMPPAGHPKNDKLICEDLVMLHFIGKAKE